MKQLFSSFYVKLSALFLILLLLMGSIYIAISVRSSIAFVKDADQRMNVGLAESIALEIAPLVKDSINTASMNHLLHYLMVINPHIEIYLLDSSGTILAYFADHAKKVKREKVSLEPIKEFVGSGGLPSIQGDDPRNFQGRKPFSAAPVRLKDNTPGYVYVILGGEQYDLASSAIVEQFMTSTIAKGLIVSIVFTGVLGVLLFFLMTKRLRRIRDVVTEFKEGNLTQRLDDGSQDDFGRLATAFNQMADTIARNIEDLKQSDDLRRELVANISHDLRTPLASIQGHLETILMKQDGTTNEETRRYAEISLRNARYLNQLVSELFELSNLNAVHAKPSKEPFSISELVQDVVLKFRSSAEKKGIEVSCRCEREIPLVSGDIGMIERALSNLLDNAIRYAADGTSVSIKMTPAEHHVRIVVSDSGPGIAAEDLPKIFLPYYRGNKVTARDERGTGLGLAITKRILELHDSDIQVKSEVDRGCTFYFDLARA